MTLSVNFALQEMTDASKKLQSHTILEGNICKTLKKDSQPKPSWHLQEDQ